MQLPLILLALAVAPQSDLIVDWDRRFPDPGPSVEIPSAVVPLSDGGAIVTAGGPVFPGGKITRLDDTGATVWQTDLFSSTRPYVIIGAANDGTDGAVIMASRFGEGPCYAFRHDANGSLVWSTEIVETTTGFFSSVLLHDAVGDGAGGIVGVGYESISGQGLVATIFHVDAAGNEVARVAPVGASVQEFYAIDRAPNGDFAVSTSLFPPGTSTGTTTNEVFLFDAQFSTVWRRNIGLLPGLARNVGFGGAGQVYIGHDPGQLSPAMIFALDRVDGSTVWQRPLAAGSPSSRVKDHAPADGGGVFVCGWAARASERRGLIQRFSASGEPGPPRLLGDEVPPGFANRNNLEYSQIVRAGEGLLLIGETDETLGGVLVRTEGVTTAYLPERGAPYCGPAVANSTGSPAVITAHGDSTAAGSNGLVLRAQGLPPGTTTLFISGSQQGTIPIQGGGQGVICLGGLLGRYSSQIGFARPDGVSEIQVDPATTPTPSGPVAILAGQTWNFQCWYRDTNPTPTSNATDAVTVTFD